MTFKEAWSKFWKWVLRTYSREIKALAAEAIDKYVNEATELTKDQIENLKAKSPDIVKRAIDRCVADKIDIASADGKMWLNAIVNKYMDEAQKEGK